MKAYNIIYNDMHKVYITIRIYYSWAYCLADKFTIIMYGYYCRSMENEGLLMAKWRNDEN